jgi:hypothetical protein
VRDIGFSCAELKPPLVSERPLQSNGISEIKPAEQPPLVICEKPIPPTSAPRHFVLFKSFVGKK